jgi:hypothetical protein
MDAYYDPATDTIHGAKEGTLIYRHEQGHQKSFKAGIEVQIQMYSWWVIICCCAWVGWTQDDWILRILFTLPLVGLTYSELYAWWYAFIGYKYADKKTKETK